MPNSQLINRAVKDSGFREKYNINILGIQRGGKYLLQDLKDEKMHSGDALLVQGTWKDIARLNEVQSEWVVVGQPLAEAAKVTLDHKAPIRGNDYDSNDYCDGFRFHSRGSRGCRDCSCFIDGVDRMFT